MSAAVEYPMTQDESDKYSDDDDFETEDKSSDRASEKASEKASAMSSRSSSFSTAPATAASTSLPVAANDATERAYPTSTSSSSTSLTRSSHHHSDGTASNAYPTETPAAEPEPTPPAAGAPKSDGGAMPWDDSSSSSSSSSSNSSSSSSGSASSARASFHAGDALAAPSATNEVTDQRPASSSFSYSTSDHYPEEEPSPAVAAADVRTPAASARDSEVSAAALTPKAAPARKDRRSQHATAAETDEPNHRDHDRSHNHTHNSSARGGVTPAEVPRTQDELDALRAENDELRERIYARQRDLYRSTLSSNKVETKRSAKAMSRKDTAAQQVREAVLLERAVQMMRREKRELTGQRAALREAVVKQRRGLRYRDFVEDCTADLSALQDEHHDLCLEMRCNEKLLLMNAEYLESGTGAKQLQEETRSRTALLERQAQHSLRDADDSERQRDAVKQRVKKLQGDVDDRRAAAETDSGFEEVQAARNTSRDFARRIQRLREKIDKLAAEQPGGATPRRGGGRGQVHNSPVDAEGEYLRERIAAMKAKIAETKEALDQRGQSEGVDRYLGASNNHTSNDNHEIARASAEAEEGPSAEAHRRNSDAAAPWLGGNDAGMDNGSRRDSNTAYPTEAPVHSAAASTSTASVSKHSGGPHVPAETSQSMHATAPVTEASTSDPAWLEEEEAVLAAVAVAPAADPTPSEDTYREFGDEEEFEEESIADAEEEFYPTEEAAAPPPAAADEKADDAPDWLDF